MYKDQKAGGEGESAPLPFLEWEAWLGVAVFGLGAGFLVLVLVLVLVECDHGDRLASRLILHPEH